MGDEKPNYGENLPVGETTTKRGPYRIDDVTNNAIVLLRNSMNKDIALMNLGVDDSVKARELLEELVKEYVDGHIPPDNEYPKNISAIVIGGDYREHKKTDEGKIVYINHRMARLRAVEALSDLYLHVTQVPTDKRAVKTVFVEQDGSFRIEEARQGLNAQDAEMSEEEYKKLLDSKP
jgi:hypothetical protein